jgi:hypothetical protein
MKSPIGDESDGDSAEPFIPLSEREPLHMRMFDALHAPDAPLVRIVTDTSLYFPSLNKRNNNNNNNNQGRRGQRRGSDGGNGRVRHSGAFPVCTCVEPDGREPFM